MIRRWVRRWWVLLTQARVVHEGATEAFGAALHRLRDIQVSPELVSDIEAELAWGQAWHEFETRMRAEVARIFAPALGMVSCLDFDEVRQLVAA